MGKLPLLKLVMMLVLLATVSATARAAAYGEFPDRPAPGKYVVLLASGADPAPQSGATEFNDVNEVGHSDAG